MIPKLIPLESKKFLAYLISEITWKLVLVIALVVLREDFKDVGVWAWGFLMTIVITAGFTEIGYIGGQAWLDRYVKVAEIARNSNTEESKDV
jgi:hypothetical protein